MRDSGWFGRFGAAVRRWRRRARMRRELAAMAAHERRDLRLRWEDAAYEAHKPFWRE